jgi:hypothetical protein
MLQHFVYVTTEHMAVHPRTKAVSLLPVGLIVRHGYEEFEYCVPSLYEIFERETFLLPDIDGKDWYYNPSTEEILEEPV